VNERAVGIFRTFLTVVGILLLVIFGSRAAAQARNMKLAGATHKSVFAVGTDIMNVLGFGKTKQVMNFEPKTISSHVPAKIQTATPIASSSSDTPNTQQTSPHSTSTGEATNTNNGLHKSTGTANTATVKTQQVVNNVTKNTSDDFTNLWP
jgi:hypothetical protein